MHRALWEFRIRGVVTNLRFLDQLIMHPRFASADYTTTFIDQTPELFQIPRKRDRATRLLSFIGDVIVNGNPEVKDRPRPAHPVFPRLPRATLPPPPPGTKQKLDALGPEGFAAWMLGENRVLLTDTSMRDAHQSLLATRFRTHDMRLIAPYYSSLLPELFSVECWGGATFDVALRFLKEDPWARLAAFRQAMPNLLLQMLFRSANAVGYTNYPDNVVRHFVAQAAQAGVDVFRVFDCLNWADNMRVAIEAVRATGRSLCEAAICYTGNLSNPRETKYALEYYLALAKELRAMGAHVLAIKDMAGLCQPRAASALVKALKDEVGLPVHFHTHDTSGIGAASVLAAIDAGADAVDGAIDALSGLTSQPNLGSIVEALRFSPRDSLLEPDKLRVISTYWEQVRRGYVAFESDIRSGASEVYVHGMPGGQYTNLREQARALGIDEVRWPELARAYSEVNEMFGDIVKVTPTSKVVGDMAITMVTTGLTRQAVLDPAVEVAFPESVVQLFRGDLGQPAGGFPTGLQKKILNGTPAVTRRPGELLPPADLGAARATAEAAVGRAISETELASYLMYPKVFIDYAADRESYGDVSALPTAVFFFGIQAGQEINIELERGKTLIVRYVTMSEAHEDGTRTVFFELNGQPRSIRVADRSQVAKRPPLRKIEAGNPSHVGAPMPGTITTVPVRVGQKLTRGDVMLTLEAMKMETTVRAERDGSVKEILARPGLQVDAKDLLMILD
jgi:pyruvate carboxylase